MLNFLGFLMVVGLAFGAGIYVGQTGPDTVLHKAKQLGADVMAKTTSVERSFAVRTGIVNAKERLVQAKSDLLDKNYGKTVSGLADATEALKTAQDAADGDLRGRLEKILGKVAAATTDAQALKPGLQTKVDDLVKELDHLLPP